MGSFAAGEPLEIYTDPTEVIDVGKDIERQYVYALVIKDRSMIQDNISENETRA